MPAAAAVAAEPGEPERMYAEATRSSSGGGAKDQTCRVESQYSGVVGCMMCK